MTTGPKMNPANKPERRGGVRPGAGKKPYSQRYKSKEIREQFVAALEKAKRDHDGQTLADILVACGYGDVKLTQAQITAARLALDFVVPGVGQEKEEKHAEPAVFLPEESPDPAKVGEVVKLVK